MGDRCHHNGVPMTRKARTALQKLRDGYPLSVHERAALAKLGKRQAHNGRGALSGRSAA